MLTHVFSSRVFHADPMPAFVALITLLIIFSCSPSAKNGGKDTIAGQIRAHVTEDFHADNDIAMVVKSLADAIRVGEPLDSTEYDFEGILTDGQGAPLYTDVQGSPGVWVVDVLDPKNVTIRNLYLGDLLPGDLESYLLQSLSLDESDRMLFTAHEAVDDDETVIKVFDFNGGYLRFEIRAGVASNGLEGPLLTIIMSAEPPVGVETQTDA